MNKEKRVQKSTWLAVSALSLVFLLLVVLNIVAGDHWIDSDMAAEMIFSKQIAAEGGLFATSDWYYSTEFRILYTQLIMVPLFHVFEDWSTIRTLTNILTYLLLLCSYFYFVRPFCCKRSTVIWSSVILLLPFSEIIMQHVQMGNTYMPHMILIFFCFGMYLRLTGKGKCRGLIDYGLGAFYVLISVICGMSGVRYMLALQVPLLLTGLWMMMDSQEFHELRTKISKENLKAVLLGKRGIFLRYSILGFFSAAAGYLINIVVIAGKFRFQTYEATNFIPVFQGVFLERIQNTIGNLLQLFGYIENKGFLSLRGLISLIAFALIAGIILLTRRVGSLMKEQNAEDVLAFDHKQLILRFFVTTFLLNTFVFVFTTSTMSARYYFTVFMFVLPLLCIYFELERLPLDRILVGLFLFGCLGLISLKGVYSFLDKDKNAEEKVVARFLQEEDYTFGYATYWNANIMTELTDGDVEVANVLDVEDMSMFYWSTPFRYYEEGYHKGKTFLLLTVQEAMEYESAATLDRGERIYEDAYYVVFHYDAVEELLQ